jgi:signal transduction histidine kinase
VQAHQRAVASGKDLLVSQDKLAIALEAANLGVWNWNVSEQRVTSDERCRVMLGLGPTQQVSLTSFGLPPIESAGDGARLQGEHRTADGRWLFTQARVYRRGKDAYVVGIVADITEDKESVLERELFVGVLGHDLRNPLSAISLQADRLAEHRDAAIKGAAERIGRASARMSSLISDMLDFVGSRRGPLPLTLGATSLDDICREVVAEIEVATPGVDIALRPGNPNGGTWDAARLNQVVQNLITNAARHSEPDSTVRVDVSERGDAAILEVHNGGKPIPDNLRQRMFDPFVSASGGPGLGLYITKRLVEAHGGMLEVESTEGGTTLRATLPRRPAP